MTKFWQLVLIITIVIAAYSNIFVNQFVIDDQYFIQEWPLTRSFTNVGTLLAGANPESQPGVYRPIRSLLYLAYYQFWGTNPIGYHLHSLLVHLVSTILVYLIVKTLQNVIPMKMDSRLRGNDRGPLAVIPVKTGIQNKDGFPVKLGMTVGRSGMTVGRSGMAWGRSGMTRGWLGMTEGLVGNDKKSWLPFTASLLFGLHPIHTESITYIAASMEMTGVVFFLVGFFAYLKNKRFLTVFFALLAFFTYEMTLTFPLILVLYELTLGKRNWKKVWSVAVATASYLLIRVGIFGISAARGDYLAYSFYHTQLTMIKMWVKYIWLLIWPVNLSHNQTVVSGFEAFMTPYSDLRAILSQTPLDLPILLSAFVIFGLIFMAIKIRSRYPLLTFIIGWFFISLLPVAYFLPQGTAFAEKYLYIASFSFVLLLAFGLDKLKKWKNLGIIITVIIVIFYTGRTIIRNQNWQSPQTLWEHESQIHPKSELAFYNLGIVYTQKNAKSKAIEAYKKALMLKPEFWQAQRNLENLVK